MPTNAPAPDQTSITAATVVAWNGSMGLVRLNDGTLQVAQLAADALPSYAERVDHLLHQTRPITAMVLKSPSAANPMALVDLATASTPSLIGSLTTTGLTTPNAALLTIPPVNADGTPGSSLYLTAIQEARGKQVGYWAEDFATLRTDLTPEVLAATTPTDAIIPTGLVAMGWTIIALMIVLVGYRTVLFQQVQEAEKRRREEEALQEDIRLGRSTRGRHLRQAAIKTVLFLPYTAPKWVVLRSLGWMPGTFRSIPTPTPSLPKSSETAP